MFSLKEFGIIFAAGLSAFTTVAGASRGGFRDHGRPGDGHERGMGHPAWASTTTTAACGLETAAVQSPGIDNPPVKFGILLYQAFEILDVYGPLGILNHVSFTFPLELSIISSADNLDVVTTEPVTASMNPTNSTVFPRIPPTHSMADPPMDLDVLIIPGGLGTRSPFLNATIDYVTAVYPNLQYLITVCTGASIAARAGVLDGKRATTNKQGWDSVVSFGTNVTWVPEARWVRDGNVWSSSGVTAGMDATFAFVDAIYGSGNATHIANFMEYDRHMDASWDPYADIFNVTQAE